jgi:hypothetical protein
MPSSTCDDAPRVAFTLAAFLLLAACGGGGSSSAPDSVIVAVLDSAGVSIIENHIDTAAVRTGWELGEQPELTIGGVAAPEASQLYSVRGATRLSDGRIAVADAGSKEIRVFDADGRPLARFGRAGEGPGEFKDPVLSGRTPGDTLVVFDAGLRRASILTADSGFIRSYQVGLEGGGYPIAQGILRDGSLAIGGGMYFSSAEGFPSGALRAPSKYLVIAPDGSLGADLGEFPAAEMYAKRSASSFQAISIPLGRVTGFAASSDHLWLGTGDSWEVRGYAKTGVLERIVRVERPLEPVTAALRHAVIEERVAEASSENEARSQRALLSELPFPSELPPYEFFRTDALDHLWVGEFAPPGEDARNWTIFDPSGRAVGRITLPERTLPLEIGDDYLLGRTLDELDVESVTLWRLRRPAAR